MGFYNPRESGGGGGGATDSVAVWADGAPIYYSTATEGFGAMVSGYHLEARGAFDENNLPLIDGCSYDLTGAAITYTGADTNPIFTDGSAAADVQLDLGRAINAATGGNKEVIRLSHASDVKLSASYLEGKYVLRPWNSSSNLDVSISNLKTSGRAISCAGNVSGRIGRVTPSSSGVPNLIYLEGNSTFNLHIGRTTAPFQYLYYQVVSTASGNISFGQCETSGAFDPSIYITSNGANLVFTALDEILRSSNDSDAVVHMTNGIVRLKGRFKSNLGSGATIRKDGGTLQIDGGSTIVASSGATYSIDSATAQDVYLLGDVASNKAANVTNVTFKPSASALVVDTGIS